MRPTDDAAMTRRRHLQLHLQMLAGASLALPGLAWADFPDQPIRLILPYAGGASGDTLTRELAAGLQAELGGTVITENKPGAGTLIGADYVAKSKPDGYNILMAGPATHVIMPALHPKMPYDVHKDFDIIGMWASVGSMITVHPSLPVKTIQELVAYSKANPGKLNYSSAGTGTGPHLGGEMFKAMTGADLTHVAYKGAAPATTALVAGEVQVSFINIPPQVPFIRTGKIRAIAVSTPGRSPLLPDVPTAEEAGLKGFLSESWYALAVPAGTPADVRHKIQQAMFKVGSDRSRRARMAAAGTDIRLLGPKEAEQYIKAEEKRLVPVIKRLDLKLD